MTSRAQHDGTCDHIVSMLWEYLDEELDDARRDRVRQHLAECEHCREYFTFQGAFLRAVAAAIDEPADLLSLRARVLDALRSEGYIEPLDVGP